MPADSRTVGSWLSRIGSAGASAAPFVTAASGPAGAAVAILSALAGIAGDVMQGAQQGQPVPLANDPGPLLDAMHAHWQARKAGGK